MYNSLGLALDVAEDMVRPSSVVSTSGGVERARSKSDYRERGSIENGEDEGMIAVWFFRLGCTLTPFSRASPISRKSSSPTARAVLYVLCAAPPRGR